MSNILNSNDFGLKIYNRFPPKYREDDVGQNFALQRYLEALSDGGFKHSIDDINGITHLIDPDKVDAKMLPILFKQYGLEVFNGIPEDYLRYLLPKLGEAWSKKGSLSIIEFITSSLSGIKVSTEVAYDESDNPIVDVKFEMDYNIGDYFPDSEQFKKLLSNFLPFYCDMGLIFNYMFYDSVSVRGDDYSEMTIFDNKLAESVAVNCEDEEVLKVVNSLLESCGVTDEITYQDKISLASVYEQTSLVIDDKVKDKYAYAPYYEEATINRRCISNPESVAVLAQAILGVSVLAYCEDNTDDFDDYITETRNEEGKVFQFVDSKTNSGYNLNSSFYTNGLHSYDIVTIGDEQTVIIH